MEDHSFSPFLNQLYPPFPLQSNTAVMATILFYLLVFIFSVRREQSLFILACRTTAKQCSLLFFLLIP
jgi:hypothetical protein